MALGLTIAWSGGAAAHAQDTTRTEPDTTARQDTAARPDSARQEAARRAADTLKAPLAQTHVPNLTQVGEAWAWGRDPLVATGALTLGELLERVPGVTVFRTGWIASPEQAAYLGQFGRVRVFYDGVELDPLDARTNGLHDLSFINLWQLEDATIEDTPGEVRVHLRSWGVRSTTPLTRVDIYTGDLETNTYGGFFGRRFARGQVLQLGARQYSTTDLRQGGDADNLALWGRLGWASPRWTVDASVLRSSRERAPQFREPPLDSFPGIDAATLVANARVAYGHPGGAGPWFQAIASTQSFEIRNPPREVIDSVPGPGGGGPGGSPQNPDTLLVSGDTTRSAPQYIVTGGVSRGPVSLVATGRLRRVDGRNRLAPSLRLGYDNPRLSLAVHGERSTVDSTLRVDASARFFPLPWLALRASLSRYSPLESGTLPTTTAARGEVGVRLGRMWVSGGLMTRDTAYLPAPVVFDTAFQAAAAGPTTGVFATMRGKVWRDVGLNIVGIRYDDEGAYRPQYEVRSQLYLDSDMRNRFPSGNLNILVAFTHEYRTQARFPIATGFVEPSQFRTWGLLLEVRLLTATLTYQYRNFMNEEYQMVPGFAMPRPINYYGVRWNFAN